MNAIRTGNLAGAIKALGVAIMFYDITDPVAWPNSDFGEQQTVNVKYQRLGVPIIFPPARRRIPFVTATPPSYLSGIT